jgi:hypothetical protein
MLKQNERSGSVAGGRCDVGGKKSMGHQDAVQITGMLYGNILHRDADQAGFDHYYALFTSGRANLKTVILEFFRSEEFSEKFVVNETPNQLAANLAHSFFRPDAVGSRDVARIRGRLIQEGLPACIAALLEDPRFRARHGARGVPRYGPTR